jgi:hypothetical protein
MSQLTVHHYKCPERYIHRAPEQELLIGLNWGVFRSYFQALPVIGGERSAAGEKSGTRLLEKVEQGIEGLRHEHYVNETDSNILRSHIAAIYYLFRPILPRGIRKYLQRAYLRRWNKLQMPQWPVDTTVDDVLGQLLLVMLKTEVATARIPFIWFWPDGASSCAIMTHDVETEAGLRNCSALMDIDGSFGMPAAYEIVPEDRYHVSSEFINELKTCGFEVNVQDLNHDGLLFRSEQEFRRRAERINAYGEKFGARGFRSGALYRNCDWFSALRFEYDMSVPNVAHLDPQRGGCCTVMPYFIDHILELPVTTTQDYSLFYVLNQYSLDLWRQQIDLIRNKHGLVSFITHPDYLVDTDARNVYRDLLSCLAELRNTERMWIATPGEVNDWWRQRAELRIVEKGTDVQIEGPGSERARLAYAEEQMGQLVFALQDQEFRTQASGSNAFVSPPR